MEKYIVNGQTFKTYDEVIAYCERNNFRVTNTETIRENVYLISVSSI